MQTFIYHPNLCVRVHILVFIWGFGSSLLSKHTRHIYLPERPSHQIKRVRRPRPAFQRNRQPFRRTHVEESGHPL